MAKKKKPADDERDKDPEASANVVSAREHPGSEKLDSVKDRLKEIGDWTDELLKDNKDYRTRVIELIKKYADLDSRIGQSGGDAALGLELDNLAQAVERIYNEGQALMEQINKAQTKAEDTDAKAKKRVLPTRNDTDLKAEVERLRASGWADLPKSKKSARPEGETTPARLLGEIKAIVESSVRPDKQAQELTDLERQAGSVIRGNPELKETWDMARSVARMLAATEYRDGSRVTFIDRQREAKNLLADDSASRFDNEVLGVIKKRLQELLDHEYDPETLRQTALGNVTEVKESSPEELARLWLDTLVRRDDLVRTTAGFAVRGEKELDYKFIAENELADFLFPPDKVPVFLERHGVTLAALKEKRTEWLNRWLKDKADKQKDNAKFDTLPVRLVADIKKGDTIRLQGSTGKDQIVGELISSGIWLNGNLEVKLAKQYGDGVAAKPAGQMYGNKVIDLGIDPNTNEPVITIGTKTKKYYWLYTGAGSPAGAPGRADVERDERRYQLTMEEKGSNEWLTAELWPKLSYHDSKIWIKGLGGKEQEFYIGKYKQFLSSLKFGLKGLPAGVTRENVVAVLDTWYNDAENRLIQQAAQAARSSAAGRDQAASAAGQRESPEQAAKRRGAYGWLDRNLARQFAWDEDKNQVWRKIDRAREYKPFDPKAGIVEWLRGAPIEGLATGVSPSDVADFFSDWWSSKMENPLAEFGSYADAKVKLQEDKEKNNDIIDAWLDKHVGARLSAGETRVEVPGGLGKTMPFTPDEYANALAQWDSPPLQFLKAHIGILHDVVPRFNEWVKERGYYKVATDAAATDATARAGEPSSAADRQEISPELQSVYDSFSRAKDKKICFTFDGNRLRIEDVKLIPGGLRYVALDVESQERREVDMTELKDLQARAQAMSLAEAEQSAPLTPEQIKETRDFFLEKIKEATFYVRGLEKMAKGVRGKFTEKVEDASAEALMEKAQVLALGDAHGSAYKILEFAVLSGAASLPPDKARQFLHIYKRMVGGADPYTAGGQFSPFESELKKNNFTTLQKNLLEAVDSVQWVGGGKELIFIGDTLGDRGLSDTVTLALMAKLREQGEVKVLASNHDLMIWEEFGDLSKSEVDPAPVSRFRAVAAADTDEARQELQRQYMKYLRSQDLMLYDAAADVLYTHAPITPALIDKLRPACGFEADITKNNVADFVAAANSWYKKMIDDWVSHKPVDPDGINLLLEHEHGFVWERNGFLSDDRIPLKGAVSRFVHGHDVQSKNFVTQELAEKQGIQLVNLDNDCRKANPNANSGAEQELDNLGTSNSIFVLMPGEAEKRKAVILSRPASRDMAGMAPVEALRPAAPEAAPAPAVTGHRPPAAEITVASDIVAPSVADAEPPKMVPSIPPPPEITPIIGSAEVTPPGPAGGETAEIPGSPESPPPEATGEAETPTEKPKKRIIDIPETILLSVLPKDELKDVLRRLARPETVGSAKLLLRYIFDSVNPDSLMPRLKQFGYETWEEFLRAWADVGNPEEGFYINLFKALTAHVAEMREHAQAAKVSWLDKVKAGWWEKTKQVARVALPAALASAGAVGLVAATGGAGLLGVAGAGAVGGGIAGAFRKLIGGSKSIRAANVESEKKYREELEKVSAAKAASESVTDEILKEISDLNPVALFGMLSESLRQASAGRTEDVLERESTGLFDVNTALIRAHGLRLAEEALANLSETEKKAGEAYDKIRLDRLLVELDTSSNRDRQKLIDNVKEHPLMMKALKGFLDLQRGETGSGAASAAAKAERSGGMDKVKGMVLAAAAGAGVGAAVAWESLFRMLPGGVAGGYMGYLYGEHRDRKAQEANFRKEAEQIVTETENWVSRVDKEDVWYGERDGVECLLTKDSFGNESQLPIDLQTLDTKLRVPLRLGLFEKYTGLSYRVKNLLRSIDAYRLEAKERVLALENLLGKLDSQSQQLQQGREDMLKDLNKRSTAGKIGWGIVGALAGAAGSFFAGKLVRDLRERYHPSHDLGGTLHKFAPPLPEEPRPSVEPIRGPVAEATHPRLASETAPAQPGINWEALGIQGQQALAEFKALQTAFPSLSEDDLAKLIELAKLGRGEGVERQLTEQMRYLEGALSADDKAKFHELIGFKEGGKTDVNTVINRAAHRLSVSEGYMTADNKYIKYPLWSKTLTQRYVLGLDQGGKLSFSHEQDDGKRLEVALERPMSKAELRGEARPVEAASVPETPAKEARVLTGKEAEEYSREYAKQINEVVKSLPEDSLVTLDEKQIEGELPVNGQVGGAEALPQGGVRILFSNNEPAVEFRPILVDGQLKLATSDEVARLAGQREGTVSGRTGLSGGLHEAHGGGGGSRVAEVETGRVAGTSISAPGQPALTEQSASGGRGEPPLPAEPSASGQPEILEQNISYANTRLPQDNYWRTILVDQLGSVRAKQEFDNFAREYFSGDPKVNIKDPAEWQKFVAAWEGRARGIMIAADQEAAPDTDTLQKKSVAPGREFLDKATAKADVDHKVVLGAVIGDNKLRLVSVWDPDRQTAAEVRVSTDLQPSIGRDGRLSLKVDKVTLPGVLTKKTFDSETVWVFESKNPLNKDESLQYKVSDLNEAKFDPLQTAPTVKK